MAKRLSRERDAWLHGRVKSGAAVEVLEPKELRNAIRAEIGNRTPSGGQVVYNTFQKGENDVASG